MVIVKDSLQLLVPFAKYVFCCSVGVLDKNLFQLIIVKVHVRKLVIGTMHFKGRVQGNNYDILYIVHSTSYYRT